MINKIIIDGMKSIECKEYLEEEIKQINFVKNVEVSLENKTAFIESDEFEFDVVKSKIEKNGKYQVKNCVCNHKLKPRNDDEKKKIICRINRVIGQLNGVAKMIEDDRYCDDVLIQLSAIINSCKSLSNFVLEEHLNSCIKENIEKGNSNVVSEILQLFKRLS